MEALHAGLTLGQAALGKVSWVISQPFAANAGRLTKA